MSPSHLEGQEDHSRREERERELALWAGGDLPPAAAARLEEHLAGCPECRALAEGLRASQHALAALAAEPIDPEALARVRRGVLRRLDERRPPRPAAPWLYAAAAALALAALGLGLWLRGSTPAQPAEVAAQPQAAPAAPLEAPRGAPPGAADATTAPREERKTEVAAADTELAPPESPPAPPSAEPPVQRAAVTPAPEAATESIVIQIVSDDPDIVFYWLVEPEESEDEAVSS
jgi:anti-sigma factor RsiW